MDKLYIVITIILTIIILQRFGKNADKTKINNAVYLSPKAKNKYILEIGLTNREKIILEAYSNNDKHTFNSFNSYCKHIEKTFSTFKIAKDDEVIIIARKEIAYMKLINLS